MVCLLYTSYIIGMKFMETERNTYMAANVTKDMTEGSPVKLILGFFIPMLCGLLFQQLYNICLLYTSRCV